ncbi:MAG: RimK family alpha-L-glutamate ligase [Planctomycetota bacterium]
MSPSRPDVLVLTTQSDSPGWHLLDLERAAGELGLHLSRARFEDLHSSIDSSGAEQLYCGTTPLRNGVLLVRSMPRGTLEQIIFRMDSLQAAERAGVRVVNPPRALEACIDKYLSTSRLAAAGLPVPATETCETFEKALEAYERLGGDVLFKPLFGSEGVGIERVQSLRVAREQFARWAGEPGVFYLQEFVANAGSDIRVVTIGPRVAGSMQRIAASDSWLSNVAQGARSKPFTLDPELEAIALSAAKTLGTEIAGVDLLLDLDGRPRILEVNAVPGWRAASATCSRDFAREILEHVASDVLDTVSSGDDRSR